MNGFKDKVAIIMGGGAGIGLVTAGLFAAKGANVLITGRRLRALEEVAASNPNIKGFAADASDPEAAARTVAAALEHWGRLDILVNNAGGGAIQPLADADAKAIFDIFGVNVIGPTLLAAAIPHLEEAKGAIVNMSCTYGSKAAAGLSLYGWLTALSSLSPCPPPV
jgi:NADP-dependent 3-hydroxy acid dehydrogenase YdfG